jgi:hypothetical protein
VPDLTVAWGDFLYRLRFWLHAGMTIGASDGCSWLAVRRENFGELTLMSKDLSVAVVTQRPVPREFQT